MPARTVRGPGPLPPAADGARPAGTSARAESAHEEQARLLRAQNEDLLSKLSRLSPAIQGLASDLAASRRECRRQQLEIAALRAENATLHQQLRAAA